VFEAGGWRVLQSIAAFPVRGNEHVHKSSSAAGHASTTPRRNAGNERRGACGSSRGRNANSTSSSVATAAGRMTMPNRRASGSHGQHPGKSHACAASRRPIDANAP
jgi:hypothetical protein